MAAARAELLGYVLGLAVLGTLWCFLPHSADHKQCPHSAQQNTSTIGSAVYERVKTGTLGKLLEENVTANLAFISRRGNALRTSVMSADGISSKKNPP
jgi:hypothetical protein